MLLTERAPDAWYDSMRATVYETTMGGKWDTPIIRLLRRALWEGDFAGRFLDREYAMARFVERNAQVKRTVSPERLLVFQVTEGWAPLCEFLGAEVPDVPFPRSNRREEWADREER